MEVTPYGTVLAVCDQERCSQRKGRGAPWGSHDLARMAHDERVKVKRKKKLRRAEGW